MLSHILHIAPLITANITKKAMEIFEQPPIESKWVKRQIFCRIMVLMDN